ncbi:MAG: M3 family peptidase, partial [Bacteroidia bacterium]
SYHLLDTEQQKIIDNEFRDFFLNGMSLNTEDKNIYKNYQTQLNELTTKFEQNVLDATDQYAKFVTAKELNGIPDDILPIYHDPKMENEANSYKITLHAPSYIPIMQYCANRKLREELYQAYTIKASEFDPNNHDNSAIIRKILKIRHDSAQLLGFKDYTEVSLYTKMAQSSIEVLDFLHNLAKKSKNQALAEFKELQDFAKETDGIELLQAWDIPYYSEKLQVAKYNYSSNELKQYFPIHNVCEGLFKLIQQLYGINFRINSNIKIWHNSVLTYELIENNQIIGYLYFDLYARNKKQAGAWMNGAQSKYIAPNINCKPVAYIVCNFAKPTGNIPCLLTFDQVQTLFHEVGHALHHLLTNINHYSIAGINNVEWDAVELPSQFMEYFTWNEQILQSISKHYLQNEPINHDLYSKLLKSRHFQSGMQMLRQLEFAIFDILIHSQTTESYLAENYDYLKLLNEVRQEIAVVIPPSYNRFPNSFTHIFGGGYASGYYSYKWAEVLATDIFSIFDTATPEQYPQLGAKLRKNILATGGLYPMLENFQQVMNRKPSIDALLKYSGINNNK